MATPFEWEGTYPPPETQLDRFRVQLTVGYPSQREEDAMITETMTDPLAEVNPV